MQVLAFETPSFPRVGGTVMNVEDATVDGTLQVTAEGTIPAPDWYESYEGRVEIVTPALTVAIAGRETDDDSGGKPAGESAPFPMNPDPWHHFGSVEGKGLDPETAEKTERTQPDKILFDLEEGERLYRIEGLNSFAARDDC